MLTAGTAGCRSQGLVSGGGALVEIIGTTVGTPGTGDP